MSNVSVYKDIVREIFEDEPSTPEVQDAADYFECWDEYDEDGDPVGESYCCFDDSVITADTTDEELHEIAKEAVADAAENNTDLSETIDAFLLNIRNEKHNNA
jgi:hypothetical protein